MLKNMKKYYTEGQAVNCVLTKASRKLPQVSMIGESEEVCVCVCVCDGRGAYEYFMDVSSPFRV